MSDKIIIFGGSGFIGTRLIGRLVKEGVFDVVSVDIRPPRQRLAKVEYITADVRDLSGLNSEGPIKAIYNLAAVHTTPGHPDHEYYETNVAGAAEVTAFARRCNVREIIFTSSISVYGPGEDAKTEQTPPAPVSAYGRSKLLAEKIHRTWQEESGARRLIIVRPAVIFGPGEGGNFTRLAKLLRKGFFIYPGRRDTIKSCFYVDDLLAAIAHAQTLQQGFILFNGCYPDRYTIEDIVKTFKAGYFTNVKEYTFPVQLVYLAATLLRPLAFLNLGIHPDRVTKLIRSTNTIPAWLGTSGTAKAGQLPQALANWAQETNNKFL